MFKLIIDIHARIEFQKKKKEKFLLNIIEKCL